MNLPATTVVTLAPPSIVDGWIARVAQSPSTRTEYLRVIRTFEKFCADSDGPFEFRDRVFTFLASRSKTDHRQVVINGATINHYAYILRSFFDEVVARGLLPTNPLSDYTPHPVRQYSNKRAVSDAAMTGLLDTLRSRANSLLTARDYISVFFMYKYAMRVSTLVALKWPEGESIEVWQKGNRIFLQPLTDEAREALAFYRQFAPVGDYVVCRVKRNGLGAPGPVSTRIIQYAVERIAPDLTTHSFRKSHAANAFAVGGTTSQVANGMAATVGTALYYSHNDQFQNNSIYLLEKKT